MALPWTGRPKFLKLVPRPANTADSELARAQTVYIDGLDDAGGATLPISSADVTYEDPALPGNVQNLDDLITVIMTSLTDLTTRVEALENQTP